VSAKGLETTDGEDTWTLRLFILLLFVMILFIGTVSAFYILANTNWDAMDKNLAVTTKLFYVYAALLGVCLLAALAWLTVDERKIRKLQNRLKS
jgi:TRAP-type C4-dicarboxylate transport system permease small subunit